MWYHVLFRVAITIIAGLTCQRMARREAIKYLENGSGECESLNYVQHRESSELCGWCGSVERVFCGWRAEGLVRRPIWAKAAIKIQGVLKK